MKMDLGLDMSKLTGMFDGLKNMGGMMNGMMDKFGGMMKSKGNNDCGGCGGGGGSY